MPELRKSMKSNQNQIKNSNSTYSNHDLVLEIRNQTVDVRMSGREWRGQ